MEEILKQEKSKSHQEFEKLLSEDLDNRTLIEGSIVTGTVSSVGEKFIWLDLKAKSEGALPLEELKLLKESYKVGDKVDVLLEKLESFNGSIVISREKARRAKTWKRIEASYEQKKNVTGMILSRCKGGFVTEIDSCLCFLPGSQVDLKPLKNFDHLMRTELTFEIVKMDKKRGNIVLSRRSILEKIRDKDKDKIMANIKVNSIVTGIVKNITQWGAFIDIAGVDALLHITDCSWSRVSSVSELLSIGQQVKVKITKVDPLTKKISVSAKHLTEDPYTKLISQFEVGGIYDGVVTKIQDYGVFCRLADGLEGLIHQSELSFVKRNVHPSKVLSTSQRIKVKLLEKDLIKRRLSLSFKQTQINPWTKFSQDHKAGDVLEGEVKNIVDFGLFATIKGTELDGLIHLNDIEHFPKDADLKKFRKGQKISFKILEIDKNAEKIRLGIRQLTESPFEFFMSRKVGDTVTAVVKSTSQNGIYVNVGKKNFTILIKKNHLAVELENQRTSRWTPGQKQDFIITQLDKENKTVSGSIKALEQKNESENIKKYGSKESGGILREVFRDAFKKKT